MTEIEHYQEFNERFFLPINREGGSLEYKTFLQEKNLELEEGLKTGNISREELERLSKICDLEATHSNHAPLHFDTTPLKNQTDYGQMDPIERDKLCPDPRHLLRLMFPRSHTYYESAIEGSEKIKENEISNGFCLGAGQEYIAFIKLGKKLINEEIFSLPLYVTQEGDEHRTFWTLFPYLILHINDAPGKRTLGVLRRLQSGNKGPYNKFLEARFKLPTVLGFDDRMPSHLLARIYASQVMNQKEGDEI